MARPIKEGLDYFSFDIDFFHDQKIEFVSAKYGIEGEIITVKLLCKIYRNGYYLNWGDDECLLFSKKVGENISFDLVKNVVDELLKRDFFNQNLYKKYNILTSKGIQKRYFEAIKRRKDFTFYNEYCLLNGVNVYNNPINVYINPQNVDINKQSKVKESKGKEIINTKETKPATPLLNKPTKEPLEFSFTDKCWYGLDDWRIKMYQGKYPMLSINYYLEDLFKSKFLEKPKEYKELIAIKYKGNVEELVWAWLGQAKKFYLRDHPDYQPPVVESVSKGKAIGRNVSHIGEELEKLKGKFDMPETAKGRVT